VNIGEELLGWAIKLEHFHLTQPRIYFAFLLCSFCFAGIFRRLLLVVVTIIDIIVLMHALFALAVSITFHFEMLRYFVIIRTVRSKPSLSSQLE